MAETAGQVRRTFPDTSALYPISVLDLLMRLAENGIHDIVWSDDLLDELEEKWREGRAAGKRVPGEVGAASALAGIRRTFAATHVGREEYEASIAEMPGSDEGDKPHSAAALAGRATHIITSDRAGGFPRRELAELGIVVQRPDTYLADLALEYPEDARRIVHEMVQRRRRREPHLTIDGLLDRWRSRVGLKRFCAQLERGADDAKGHTIEEGDQAS